jgi:hypothetical protein
LESRLTNESCTAPQKHVAVASSSVDQPSSAPPARGKYGFDLSMVEDTMVSYFCGFVRIVSKTISFFEYAEDEELAATKQALYTCKETIPGSFFPSYYALFPATF